MEKKKSGIIRKAKISMSIDIEVLKEFDRICDDKSINRSSIVNKMIKKWVEENKIK